jgi:type I restriction enzyme R subunit
VDPAPVVIDKLKEAVKKLDLFMQSQGLGYAPEEVNNLKGDAARSIFIERFKDVQRFKTQLDQYTDLTVEDKAVIEGVLPEEQLLSFRSAYLETAQRLKEKQEKDKEKKNQDVQQLDFEFVLFASAIIDYDYIMKLIARYTAAKPGKQTMTRKQLIGLIDSDAKFMDEREDMTEYINSLQVGKAMDETAIRAGYAAFKAEKNARELAEIAQTYGLPASALQTFVDEIMQRMVFDSERLTDLLAPLELGWKARAEKELELMTRLIPHLNKLAQGREISGLNVYEQ